MRKLSEINIKNKRILIRVDFNVPLDNTGKILSNFRIRATLPTIKYCINQGARITLISHLGRPSNKEDKRYSLKPIVNELKLLLKSRIYFSEDCISNESIKISRELFPGEIHLLENLRFYKDEKNNDKVFAKKLSKHGHIFINDAFGTAHRKHASNVRILEFFDTYCYGLLCEKELKYFKHSLICPNRPYTVIMGGSKIFGKIELIENLMQYADNILIGGAMANPFLKVKGENIGAARVDIESYSIAEMLLKKTKQFNVDIILPLDVIASDKISNNSKCFIMKHKELSNNLYGYDIGPESCALFNEFLVNSNTVFWNGPLGVTEISQFSLGTQSIASILKNLTDQGVQTVIGGGDTASALISGGYDDCFSHISTGGGASIQLLSGKELPAFSEKDINY